MAHRVDYADLYFQYSRSESWSLEEGIVKSGSFNIDQGVGVRAVSGEKTAFAYSDDISLAALTSAAEATRAIARQGQTGRTQVVTRRAGHNLYVPQRSAGESRGSGEGRACSSASSATRAPSTRASPRSWLILPGEYEVILVARSDGVLAADVRPLVRLSLQVIVEQDGRREQGSSGGGGRFDYALLHRRRAQGLREEGGGPGARQSRSPARARGHHDRRARPGLAGRAAARGGRPRPRRRFQSQGHIRLQRPDRRARGGAGRDRRRRRHDRDAGAARSTSTTRAIRRSATC